MSRLWPCLPNTVRPVDIDIENGSQPPLSERIMTELHKLRGVFRGNQQAGEGASSTGSANRPQPGGVQRTLPLVERIRRYMSKTPHIDNENNQPIPTTSTIEMFSVVNENFELRSVGNRVRSRRRHRSCNDITNVDIGGQQVLPATWLTQNSDRRTPAQPIHRRVNAFIEHSTQSQLPTLTPYQDSHMHTKVKTLATDGDDGGQKKEVVYENTYQTIGAGVSVNRYGFLMGSRDVDYVGDDTYVKDENPHSADGNNDGHHRGKNDYDDSVCGGDQPLPKVGSVPETDNGDGQYIHDDNGGMHEGLAHVDATSDSDRQNEYVAPVVGDGSLINATDNDVHCVSNDDDNVESVKDDGSGTNDESNADSVRDDTDDRSGDNSVSERDGDSDEVSASGESDRDEPHDVGQHVEPKKNDQTMHDDGASLLTQHGDDNNKHQLCL